MRVIMTGGGTGGHIYPAIAIADRIMMRTNGSEIIFVGTKKGLESDLVPKHGYPLKFIEVSGINRKRMLANVKVIKQYVAAKRKAKQIIADFKPDIVIGTGGYVAGPVVKAASEMGIKTCIHEQNASPGLTNRMLEPKVNKVFLGFQEASKHFKDPKKHIFSGNPVRDEFFGVDRQAKRRALGLEEDQFAILVFGGSRGAGRINKAMLDVIGTFAGKSDYQIFFATGQHYYKPILKELEERDIALADNIHIIEYIDHMEDYLTAADLAITRSGALTVAEITVCGVASVLIPSPNVTGDHQTFNAEAIADKGGAILLPESELTGEKLCSIIEGLKNDQEAVAEMAAIAKKNAPLDASDIIYYNLNV